MNGVEQIEKISQFLLKQGHSDLKRFTASYVASQLEIPIEHAVNILDWISQRSPQELSVAFEVMCPNCHRSLEIYESLEQIPFQEELECIDCEDLTETQIDDSCIWRVYTYKPGKQKESKDDSKKKFSKQEILKSFLTSIVDNQVKRKLVN